MMKHNDIIGLMNETTPYSKSTLPALTDLIERYPYFQTAHVLHTLNLLHLKDTHFLYDLRKTAVYVPDRRQLFFRVENRVFEPRLMEMFERKTLSADSTFELVDTFLSTREEKMAAVDKTDVDTAIEIYPESLPASTDYVSQLLPDSTEENMSPPLQHQDMIDKFLELDAISPIRIKPAGREDREESAEKQIKQAETELIKRASEPPSNENYFTETLAKIYIKQKKYGKALEIIRQLNLIYPEKSRYFADQIRFLEKLNNYSN